MRVGLQYVWQSSRLRAILLRISLYFLHSTALLALLPLVARSLPGGQAGTFTVLLASMGGGAIVAALLMPRIRAWLPLQERVLVGTAIQAAAAVVVAFAPNIYVAVPAMVLSGTAWITVANSLTVAAQMALPDWVRARGMSIYQMALMGSTAVGAALWGQVATWAGIQVALAISAVTAVVLMAAAQRLVVDRGTEEDLTPSRVFKVPEMQAPPRAGRIRVNIEYRIDPARTDDFLALMQESRRSRLSQGALDWQLLHDLYDPARFIEQITDESWTEHLRRFDRVTASDVQLRDRRLSFHVGEEPPLVTRFLIEQD
jgi:quinol monooxygenase YgiN